LFDFDGKKEAPSSVEGGVFAIFWPLFCSAGPLPGRRHPLFSLADAVHPDGKRAEPFIFSPVFFTRSKVFPDES